uniref:CopG family transcriptional regulator n=1 Tax=Candidatus Kentrum sp. DK TaxID=2126562 RepID=A0A450SZ24_9GAMM|nr:MAG: hypothetical protein BECKDK2373B_GA0170837_108315 [Candidatus Kentron sp. DK]
MTQRQVHLTETQQNTLAFLAHERGGEQTDLIREAVDSFLAQQPARRTGGRPMALNRLAGIWRDRTDLPDFNALRREWDRTLD